MASHSRAGIGSVAIIELFIGSQRRFSPGSAAVKPSVARSTTGALHRAQRRRRPSRADLGDRGALVDVDAEPFDGVGQAAGQLRRLDPRAVRVVVGRDHAVEPNTFGRFVFR